MFRGVEEKTSFRALFPEQKNKTPTVSNVVCQHLISNMTLYECRYVPGKGRCLIAAQDIKAGDVIFTDMPLLLYPQIGGEKSFCAHCLGNLHLLSTLCIPSTKFYQKIIT